MKRSKYDKIELLKGIAKGQVPKEALNPPPFVFEIDKQGYFHYMISGKDVDKDHFFTEVERLHTDWVFKVHFRSAIESDLNS